MAVGHWTDERARTGCTVVLFPDGAVASGEVRGGAPGTREWALLAPERLVDRIDAVVLSGGSAFGLAACDGVMAWCEERGRGFPTPAGPVPIVVGMVLFDLMVGDPSVRPDAAAGRAACETAHDGSLGTGGQGEAGGTGGTGSIGAVGAGTGATVGGWRGPGHTRPGGIGTATQRSGDLVVGALVAVNAAGDLRDGDTEAVPLDGLLDGDGFARAVENTTIGVVATNGALDKAGCLLVAQGAHDGLARALEPVHTAVDGDAFVAASTGGVPATVDKVRALAARAVDEAVRSALV